MTKIKLKHYFGLPENEIVKIKLRTQEDFVYGLIALIGQTGPATGRFSVENANSATMSKIDNYDDFLRSPKEYIGHSLLHFYTEDIESIDIVEIQMNSNKA